MGPEDYRVIHAGNHPDMTVLGYDEADDFWLYGAKSIDGTVTGSVILNIPTADMIALQIVSLSDLEDIPIDPNFSAKANDAESLIEH